VRVWVANRRRGYRCSEHGIGEIDSLGSLCESMLRSQRLVREREMRERNGMVERRGTVARNMDRGEEEKGI
jgi:hypothetical protein